MRTDGVHRGESLDTEPVVPKLVSSSNRCSSSSDGKRNELSTENGAGKGQCSTVSKCLSVLSGLTERSSCSQDHADILGSSTGSFLRRVTVGSDEVFEGTLVICLILRSLWGLYKIHETLWFYLVAL